eukprot:s1574_g4.t1
MVRHWTLLFALSGFLVLWFGLSFDPGAASIGFAVENQGTGRPKKDNRIHTPASSTDRLDHYGLTKTDKIKLSQLREAGKQGNWRQVQRLFDSSKDLKIPMFNAYMTAAMRCEQFQEGARMYEKLCKFSLPKELATYNLAVKLYAKSGQADLARQAANKALARFGLDHTLGAAWLVAAAEVGDFQEARHILEKMTGSNVTVDKTHITTALRAVRKSSKATSADATKLFEMTMDLGLKPDVGLCHSFLSSLEESELEDFQMMDDVVERFEVDVNSAYVQTYFRQLLFLGRSYWSEAELRIHLRNMPGSHREAALRALDSFELKIKMPPFCKMLERALSGQVATELPPGPRPRVARAGLRGWLKNRRKGADVAKVASHAAEENATSLPFPPELLEDLEADDPVEDPVAVKEVEPRREGFMRESQFWRWTGALGWSLDFILLCWALFLRKIGIIDQGQDWTGLGSQLESLRLRAEEILRPTEEKLPNYDDVLISKKIGELQVALEEIFYCNCSLNGFQSQTHLLIFSWTNSFLRGPTAVADRIAEFWRARRNVLESTVATLYSQHRQLDPRDTLTLAALFHSLPHEWPVQPHHFSLSLDLLFDHELGLWWQRAADSVTFQGTIRDAWNSQLNVVKLLPFFLAVLSIFAERAGIAREFPVGFALTIAPWLCPRSLHVCFKPLKPEHGVRPRLFALQKATAANRNFFGSSWTQLSSLTVLRVLALKTPFPTNSPLGMGWEFRPTFLWPMDQPEHDPDNPHVIFGGAARFLLDIFARLCTSYGQTLDSMGFDYFRIPVDVPAAAMWRSSTSRMAGPADLDFLRNPTSQSAVAPLLRWPQIQPLPPDLVLAAREHLHLVLTGILTCFNEMKLPQSERAGPPALDENRPRPHRQQKPPQELSEPPRKSTDEEALRILLQRCQEQTHINVKNANQILPRRLGFRSDQQAICRLFDFAAQHHAGVRKRSPGAALRLRLTLPNIDAAFRQRLNLQLSMPSTAAAEDAATAGAGKRGRRAQGAPAEQEDAGRKKK